MTDNLRFEYHGPVTVAHLSGRIHALTVPVLAEALEAQLVADCQLVLEMSAVEFMSSSGLWLLYNLQRQLPAGGKLCLVGPSDAVRTTLELVGFASLLRTFESLEDALEEVGRAS